MEGGVAQNNPRTVEEVFRDFKGRRAGMIKALTTGFRFHFFPRKYARRVWMFVCLIFIFLVAFCCFCFSRVCLVLSEANVLGSEEFFFSILKIFSVFPLFLFRFSLMPFVWFSEAGDCLFPEKMVERSMFWEVYFFVFNVSFLFLSRGNIREKLKESSVFWTFSVFMLFWFLLNSACFWICSFSMAYEFPDVLSVMMKIKKIWTSKNFCLPVVFKNSNAVCFWHFWFSTANGHLFLRKVLHFKMFNALALVKCGLLFNIFSVFILFRVVLEITMKIFSLYLLFL